MRSDRVVRGRWLLAALAASGMVGADKAPPATGSAKPAVSKGPALPEVVRSEEFEDVAGAARPSESPAARKAREVKPTWMAADVDAVVDRQLAEAKAAPAPLTSDDAFLRRLTLDTLGRPPEITEIRRFGAARDPNKRAAMVDALLQSPEFGTNWARYWRDVVSFRSPNENERTVDYPEFVDWLAAKLNSNVRWDQIAADVITATGRTDENGATVFTLAEEADPVELAGEVSRVFLGIQIQCAQCHDHPSDPWKRQQFHEFAAFFAGVKRKQVQRPAMGQKAVFEITSKGPTRYAMADLKDPEKKIPVDPKFFLGASPSITGGVSAAGRLKLAAEYVTSPENPWFARSFVNRVWTALMGEGFYDLVDDLGPTREAKAAELLDGLANQFVAHNYDVRWLFATILKSKAYGREARSSNSAAGRTPFASNIPSRLRADQIYDALDQAFNIDQFVKNRAAAVANGVTKKAARKAAADPDMKPDEAIRRVVDHAFGVDPSIPTGDVVGTIPQALYLMNSPLVGRATQARPGTMLGGLLASAGSPREAVEVLYLKTLARKPNPKELAVCLRHLESAGSPREGYEDILWGLVNSTEFISRR